MRNSFLVNFVYRPPNSNQTWIDLYEEQLDIVDCLNVDYYLLGDFNVAYVAENSIENFKNRKWKDLIIKFGLEQLIKLPTRTTKRSSSIIDHIYTNCHDNVKDVFTSQLALSDHFPVCFTYSNYSSKSRNNAHQSIKYRSFNNFDEHAFQNHLFNAGLDIIETQI